MQNKEPDKIPATTELDDSALDSVTGGSFDIRTTGIQKPTFSPGPSGGGPPAGGDGGPVVTPDNPTIKPGGSIGGGVGQVQFPD